MVNPFDIRHIECPERAGRAPSHLLIVDTNTRRPRKIEILVSPKGQNVRVFVDDEEVGW